MPEEIDDSERDFLRETAVRVGGYVQAEEIRDDVLRAANLIDAHNKSGAERIRSLVDDINLNRAAIAEVIRSESFHLTPESLSRIMTDASELATLYDGLATGSMNQDQKLAHNHCRTQLRGIENRLKESSIPAAKGIFEREGVELGNTKVVNLMVMRSSTKPPANFDSSMDRKSLEAELAGVRIRLDDFRRNFEKTWENFMRSAR